MPNCHDNNKKLCKIGLTAHTDTHTIKQNRHSKDRLPVYDIIRKLTRKQDNQQPTQQSYDDDKHDDDKHDDDDDTTAKTRRQWRHDDNDDTTTMTTWRHDDDDDTTTTRQRRRQGSDENKAATTTMMIKGWKSRRKRKEWGGDKDNNPNFQRKLDNQQPTQLFHQSASTTTKQLINQQARINQPTISRKERKGACLSYVCEWFWKLQCFCRWRQYKLNKCNY